MKILVTHPFGLGGVCMTELRQMGFSPVKKGYGLAIDSVQWKDIYRVNLLSRIANKVFVVLAEQKVMDFDGLFDLIGSLDWKEYIGAGHGVRVLAHSRDSQLSSTRTIQSIAHKSILTQLTGSREVHWETDDNKSVIEISVDIYKDMATVLLNTSGASLHERGYRTEQWEAPLKENIAAGLLMLTGWDKKSPLFDPFCGSGTICIEAAMRAADIAPGLSRKFAFEEFGSFDGFLYDWLRQSVQSTKAQAIPNGRQVQSTWYNIFGSDIDGSVLVKAKANADRAWVGHMIDFQEKHFLDVHFRLQTTDSGLQEWGTYEPGLLLPPRRDRNDNRVWCVTNPPYGVRLGEESVELVEDLVSVFTKQRLFGGFLLLRGAMTPGFSSIDLLNGQQEVCFYKK